MAKLADLQEQEALERYESLTDEEKVIWNECYVELVEELKKCDIDTARWSKSMFVDDCIRLMTLRAQHKEKEYADEKQMCLYQYKIFGG
jgi:hypothetical protein